MIENKTGRFNAEEFVDNLLKDGVIAACDESTESFNQNDVPSFYNEEIYKRGQKFYHRNIFGLFFSKILGLLTLLSIPPIIKILMHTKMSSTPMTAYKRYLGTVFHMCIWYDGNFTPGSELWKSMCNIKNRHNSVSKKCCTSGMSRINQRDMVLTQFGFMGYALARSEMVGIHNESDEDFYAFTHIWRVVGYIMGIEDRFNICRESVEETREICKVLIEKIFKPQVEKKDKDFIEMSTYLVNGMWSMNPLLQANVFLVYMYNLVKNPLDNLHSINNNDNNHESDEFIKLNPSEVSRLNLIRGGMYYMKFSMLRIFVNLIQFVSLWLMKVFPFLAYYQFGYANSYINIYA